MARAAEQKSKFRFSGGSGGNSAQRRNILSSDLRSRGSSYLVAGWRKFGFSGPRSGENKLSSDLRSRGNSDLVEGLEEIQI